MMCNYKDPVRKNLYDHWRIQHKIQVILRPDGTAKCVLSDREIELVDYHEEASEVLNDLHPEKTLHFERDVNLPVELPYTKKQVTRLDECSCIALLQIVPGLNNLCIFFH